MKLNYGFNLTAQLLHGPQRGAYSGGRTAAGMPNGQPAPFSQAPGRRPIVNPKVPPSLRPPAFVNPGFLPVSPLGATPARPVYTPTRVGVQKATGFKAAPSTGLTLNRGLEPMKAAIPFQPQPGPQVAFNTALRQGVTMAPAPLISRPATPVTVPSLAKAAQGAAQASVASQGAHIDSMADAQALYSNMRQQEALDAIRQKAIAQANKAEPIIIQQGAPSSSSLPGISAGKASQMDAANIDRFGLKRTTSVLSDANGDGYVSAAEQGSYKLDPVPGGSGSGAGDAGGANPLALLSDGSLFFREDGSPRVGRMAVAGAAALAIIYAASRS